MNDYNSLSEILYSNELDIKKFENLLSHNAQGYKFFWLEAIINLLPEKEDEIRFDEIIDEMIWEAWRIVTYYHLRLGPIVNGSAANYLERAIRTLYNCAKDELSIKMLSKEQLKGLIRKYNEQLREDKIHLTDYVPYRLISPFLDKLGKDYVERKDYARFIAYLDGYNKMHHGFFYGIVDAENELEKKIRISEEWKRFILQNHAIILGWIRYKKAAYLQNRNPGVPGIIYKLSVKPQNERHLENARKLWKMASEIAELPLREIYTGNKLSVDDFTLDHFVPKSYVANDELWNLTPMGSRLNSSKNNKLPDWEYAEKFVGYQYEFYEAIFKNTSGAAEKLLKQFEKCKTYNVNASWAAEELYIAGKTDAQFKNLLRDNLKLTYDAAKLQSYEIWRA